MRVTSSLNVDVAPPAKRQDLTHSGIYAERGKPVIFLFAKESKPRGKPTGWRVWETGKSEGRFAMKRIKVETSSCAKAGRLPDGLN